MPEGDVLRLTAERLEQALRGAPLVRAELRWPSAAGADLTGRTVVSCVAYGKHLLTRFDDGRTLHTHLRMDGSWRVERTGDRAAAAHRPEVRAVLATARWTAVGWRLGMLDLGRTHDEAHLLGHLGPDVLGDDFPGDGIDEGVRRLGEQGHRPLCDVLLDQRVVAGLGTIWMAETLHALAVHPWTPTGTLDDAALRRLLSTARRLMGRSVDVGRARGLQHVPRAVHGQLGRPCRRCRTPIAVGQANEPPYERPVFWCPTCQATHRTDSVG
ncbi:DNA-formamidopyrimidine glycosylase family protein [Isoptericola croceus]|uniref:DNA-formamidopyrimidine glycosylase family protein n=1 Tax=Isoptericola croceus TaxID=3031406 RepID=UPI0023FA0824|nr:DNA-formamidopyrimidine glycosylase family protein [Isoptericola croceus]